MTKKRKPTIKVDMSNWDMGNMGYDVSEIISVDRNSDGGVIITIDVDGDLFEKWREKIAAEAIRAYVESGDEWDYQFGPDGMRVGCDSMISGPTPIVPWTKIGTVGLSGARALLKFAQEEMEFYSDADEDGENSGDSAKG